MIRVQKVTIKIHFISLLGSCEQNYNVKIRQEMSNFVNTVDTLATTSSQICKKYLKSFPSILTSIAREILLDQPAPQFTPLIPK